MKLTKGNVDLGHFWFTNFWVPPPPPPASLLMHPWQHVRIQVLFPFCPIRTAARGSFWGRSGKGGSACSRVLISARTPEAKRVRQWRSLPDHCCSVGDHTLDTDPSLFCDGKALREGAKWFACRGSFEPRHRRREAAQKNFFQKEFPP